MKMSKVLALVLAVVLVLAMVTACGAPAKQDQANGQETKQVETKAADAKGTEAKAEAKKLRIFVEHCSNSWEVAYQWWYGAKRAGQELGIQVDGGAADDNSVEKNVALIEQAIAMKYDGIASLSLVSDSYAVVYDKAFAAGIPITTYHMDAPQSKRVAFFGPNHETYAKHSARFIADEIGKKGKVITIQGTASDTESFIIDTFAKEMKAYAPDVKIVANVNDCIDPAKAYEKITAALQANKDVVGSFSCTGRGGADFAKVCDDLKIKLVSNVTMDPLSFNLELLKAGKLTGIVDQGALMTGYNAVKCLNEFIVNKSYLELGFNS